MVDPITSENIQPPTPQTSKWSGVRFFLILMGFALIAGALGYGYFQFMQMNAALDDIAQEVKQKANNHETAVAALQQSVSNLQQSAQKSQELSAQQEHMLTEWEAAQKGNLDKWHVAEAQYLVKLANDNVQFTQDIPLAIVLLKRADESLQNLQDPALLEIRKSIAGDIANLEAIPQINTTAIYLRLTGLDTQLEQLPLPINPLKTENTVDLTAPLPAGLPWWKAGLERSWQALRKIVIVRYNGSNALPLVMPDEKNFLFQNLHAQMENAMWGLLHKNAEIYQASLGRAIAWVQQYFVQDAQETKTMLMNLQELQKTNVQPTVTNLSATLALFDKQTSLQQTSR